MNTERFDAILEAAYKEIEWSLEETSRINRRNPLVPLLAGAAFATLLFIFILLAVRFLH